MKLQRHALLVVAAAVSLAMTACEKRNNNDQTDATTTQTNTAVDQTSGTSGMSAETAPATGQTTTEPGSKSATTNTSPAASGDASDAKKDGSTSSGTTSANDPAANPATSKAMTDQLGQKADSISKFHEPQSKTPDKTGSTSLTGEDRSHAQAMQKKGVFVDPTVEPKMDMDTAANQSVQQMNLGQYPYNRRDQFKTAMDNRLGLIEERIGAIKSSANADKNKSLLSSIEQKHEAAETKLDEVDKVDKNRWEGYKIEFRDQIADLERSLEMMSTAKK